MKITYDDLVHIHTDNKMTNLDDLPDDYYVKQSAFTKSLYRDIYPAINPLNEKLSQKGKVIVITGASHGIGQKVHRLPGLCVAIMSNR